MEDFMTSENRNVGLTAQKYNLIIGLILLWGLVANVIMCVFFTDYFAAMDAVSILVGYFVSCLAGIAMVKLSSNPLISFIGYNLIVLPVGTVLTLIVSDYYITTIINTCIVTGIIVILMIVLSTIKPEVFLSMGKILFISLLSVLIIEILMILFGIAEPRFMDIIVALIFTGYIGFDWAIAQKKEKTLDNAVDSAAELYLDIINLFIRILSISKDD